MQRDMAEIEARIAAARRLGEVAVRDMVPAQRDVLRAITTHRRALAFVATVTSERDLQRAIDAAVSAVAAPEALLRTAAQAGPPVVAVDLCVSKAQAFAARIAGADAVLVPACLPPNELQQILSGATSAHMLSILEVCDASELGAALEHRPRAMLLRHRSLASSVRQGTTLICEADDPSTARVLKGVVDAALASRTLALDPTFQSLVSELDR